MRTRKALAIAVAAALLAPVVTTTSAFAQGRPMANQDWWPERLDLSALRQQDPASNPFGADFDYAAEFATLDLDAVKRDLTALTSANDSLRPPKVV